MSSLHLFALATALLRSPLSLLVPLSVKPRLRPGAPDPDHVRAEIFLSPQFALGGMEDHLIGKVEGSWRSRECRIGVFRESARVVRGAGVPEAADSYLVEVSAGMDVAFVTMIVLALNEIYSGEDEGHDEEALLME